MLPSSIVLFLISLPQLPPAIATHTIDTKLAHTIDTNRLFAVVALGASQYKVTPGDVLIVDKIRGAEVGTFVTLNNVSPLSRV